MSTKFELYQYRDIRNIRDDFIYMWQRKMYAENRTLEIIGESFIASEPSIFGTPNEKYIEKEISWYMSQSREIAGLGPDIPEIWQRIANNNGTINSNYGWCLFSSENFYQYQYVYRTLAKDKYSRQGVFIYTRPTMHYDATADGMSDFICTNSV